MSDDTAQAGRIRPEKAPQGAVPTSGIVGDTPEPLKGPETPEIWVDAPDDCDYLFERGEPVKVWKMVEPAKWEELQAERAQDHATITALRAEVGRLRLFIHAVDTHGLNGGDVAAHLATRALVAEAERGALRERLARVEALAQAHAGRPYVSIRELREALRHD